MNDDLRYPIGNFEKDAEISGESRLRLIEQIAELPAKLAKAVDGLDDSQLETPYRPGGWTVRQTVHHVADSHINSVIRFKLALTEDTPEIKPYDEALWAELADNSLDIGVSLQIIRGLHFRWAHLLRSFTDDDFKRTLIHPDSGEWRLDEFMALYAWHGRHHTAHITALRKRSGW